MLQRLRVFGPNSCRFRRASFFSTGRDLTNADDAGVKGGSLAKFLSSENRVLSTREAKRAIREGFVTVNGEIALPTTRIKEGDKVHVSGVGTIPWRERKLQTKLFLAHKVRKELVTRADPRGRNTLFARLASMGVPSSLISVGRLDFLSDGLILLTNDGKLARYLEHPAAGFERKYKVTAWSREPIGEKRLRYLNSKTGMYVNNIQYQPMDVKLLSEDVSKNLTSLEFTLTEGKKNEIRRVLLNLGLNVETLTRTHYGPFRLGNLPKGAVVEVTTRSLDLKHPDWRGIMEEMSASPTIRRKRRMRNDDN